MHTRDSILHSMLLATFMVFSALLSGWGCLTEQGVGVTRGGLSERFTLDRQPLSLTQLQEDPRAGNFTRTDGQLASYVFPLVSDANRLLQADCLWLAQESGSGEDLLLNWEAYVVLDVEFGGGLALADGDEELSLCRFNDPVTRQQPLLVDDDYTIEEPAMILTAPDLDGLPINFGDLGAGDHIPSAGQDIAVEYGREIFGVNLVEIPSGASNPDRQCDDLSQPGEERAITQGVLAYDGAANDDGLVATCSGAGRRIRPERDARFEARFYHDGVASVTQDFGVVMLAGSGEQLRRPLSPAANGSLRWRADFENNRWSENFSPSLLVDEVRVLQRGASGDRYLSANELARAALCLRSDTTSTACRWTCAPQVLSQGAGGFRPLDGSCVFVDGNEMVARLTPTYDVDEMQSAPLPPATPLQWQINLDASENLLLEFRLVTELSPIAVMMDGLTVFGDIPPGQRRDRLLTLRNAGFRSVRIDAIDFDPLSLNPDAFSIQVVANPTPVPVPIEIVNEREAGEFLRLAEDYTSFPALTLIGDIDGDWDTWFIGVQPTDFGEQVFELNGETVSFDGSLALTQNPDADFQASLAPGVSRPYQLIAFSPRNPPFVLAPGESVRINARAEPLVTGEISARVRVDYSDPANPTQTGSIFGVLSATGLHGPIPTVIPQSLVLTDASGVGDPIRNLALGNAGDQAFEASALWIDGADASHFEILQPTDADVVVNPGDFAVITIKYYDTCAAPESAESHQAQLILESNTNGELQFPIQGWSVSC